MTLWDRVEGIGSVVLIWTMVVVGALQILVRYIPSQLFDFFWTEELSRMLLVWLTFWGAASLQRIGEHIALTALAERLPGAAQVVIQFLVDTVTLVVLGLVLWYGLVSALATIGQQTVGLGVTLAVFAFPVPVCAALMIGYTLYRGWLRLTGRTPMPGSA